MKRKTMNPQQIIQTAFKYDDHRSSDKPKSISTTQLLGPLYKAWKCYTDAPKTHPLDVMKKRSSFIGTSIHSRFEHIFKDYTDITQEYYKEKYIKELDSWVSGTFDMLIMHKGKLHLADIKSGYGKAFSKTEQASKQLSIYRYLNQSHWTIDDMAYIYFISQSNNVLETIEIELYSLEMTEDIIMDTLVAIQTEPDFVDCHTFSKFKQCDWCEFECDYRK